MKTNDVIALLKDNLPIAICDGSPLTRESDFEIFAMSLLKHYELSCETEVNLYGRTGYDLSGYKTIFFNTNGDASGSNEKFAKIADSFSKENLKVIVVGGSYAYKKIKLMAQQLGITVLDFKMWDAWCQLEADKEMWRESTSTENYPDLDKILGELDNEEIFSDPEKKYGNKN